MQLGCAVLRHSGVGAAHLDGLHGEQPLAPQFLREAIDHDGVLGQRCLARGQLGGEQVSACGFGLQLTGEAGGVLPGVGRGAFGDVQPGLQVST